MNSRNKIVLLAGATLVLPLLFFFALRDGFLERIVHRYAQKMALRTGYHLSFKGHEFSGLLTVRFTGITAVHHRGDTLLRASTIIAHPSVMALISGRFPLDLVSVDSFAIDLNALHLPDSVQHANDSGQPKENSSGRIVWRIRHLLKSVMDMGEVNMSLKSGIVRYRAAGHQTESLQMREAYVKDQHLLLDAYAQSGAETCNYHFAGTFDPGDGLLKISGRITGDRSYGVPFLKSFAGITLAADTLSFELEETGNDRFRLMGFAGNGKMHHYRIGPDTVRCNRVSFSVHLETNPRWVSVQTPSVITVNRLPIHFSLLAIQSDTTRYHLGFQFDSIPSTQFFESLPEGLFESLSGLHTSGSLSYRFEFAVNPDHPDDLHFSSSLKGHRFRIDRYGNENFSVMADPFTHRVVESGKEVRSIITGPENPDFIPLTEVDTNLINAILICEDPSFFRHRGFSETAFRQSIATNIRERRFARGGSTLSMQLVKNVYLSRKKTIARKVEEALIVWLIENNRLVSKERMLEVYLNIIEWGPGIYGVGEASRFYFDKRPAELNLMESIYLASIIPRPRYFQYAFTKDGQMKPYMKSHFRLVADRMALKAMITPEVAASLDTVVQFKGNAVHLLHPPADTVSMVPRLEVPLPPDNELK